MGNKFDALFRGLQGLGDDELKSEMLGLLTELQHDVRNKQGQIESLRAQLDGTGCRAAAGGVQYDPPV